MDLKEVLMRLGNRLVTAYGYIPSAHKDFLQKQATEASRSGSLGPLVLFTCWLNENEDARVVLAEMGIEWPVVEAQK